MGSPVTEKIRLAVSFNAPERTIIELQGPALDAYNKWVEDGDDISYDELADAIMEQCEEHVAAWTMLDEWNYAN